jgi:hypothetical protein
LEILMPLFYSPHRPDLTGQRVVFLGGSIEMGKAIDWQSTVSAALLEQHPDLFIANPRRQDWDSSWEQSIHNPQFNEQVNWELDHLERADLVVFFFQPDTYSPITLLELGKRLEHPAAHANTLVCCPPGFWRRGNVEIVCDRSRVPLLSSLEELVLAAGKWAFRS